MKNILNELEKVDKLSVLVMKSFSVISILGVILGYIATVIFKEIETGRYFLIMSASLMAEGVWGGILIDCIKRRAGN